MNQVSLLSTITDAEAARLVSPATRDSLAEQIMSTPRDTGHPTPAPADRLAAAGSRRRPARRRWLVAVPAVATAAAVAALAAITLASPGPESAPGPGAGQGRRTGQPVIGPAPVQAQVLSFTRHGRYLDVVVTNPLAAPAAYRAEFAAHHLNITLNLVPVSPSLVGTLVYMGLSQGAADLTTITAQGRCWTGGGGSACPVGVRVPADFRGSATITFGRAARPGEQYESAASPTAPGEAMHGLTYHGAAVPAVLAMLRARHVSVPQYRYQSAAGGLCGSLPHPIPATWRVYNAVPWAPQQVLLWVGPPAGAATPHCKSSGTPSPVASPTRSAA
jgi:hypothetical protein